MHEKNAVEQIYHGPKESACMSALVKRKLHNQLDTNLSFVFCCGKVMHAKLLKEGKIPGNMRVLTVYLCCQEKSGQGC